MMVQADGRDVAAAMRASFEAKKQATMDRLTQDETQALCTRHAPAPLPSEVADKIMALNRATIKLPIDGHFFGDFKNGEVIAQTGTGLQSSDDPARPAGGNCYACHELAGSELAFGTIGPSLRRYGKLRGNSPEVLEYTWGKLYNSNAQMPCSNMPRFGHHGILTEQQLKDLMALLFDPASPVNQ
ncbi:MAG: sulfur oxidation c-type cytochrome SoxX [Gammaproteobacteria bacterium]